MIPAARMLTLVTRRFAQLSAVLTTMALFVYGAGMSDTSNETNDFAGRGTSNSSTAAPEAEPWEAGGGTVCTFCEAAGPYDRGSCEDGPGVKLGPGTAAAPLPPPAHTPPPPPLPRADTRAHPRTHTRTFRLAAHSAKFLGFSNADAGRHCGGYRGCMHTAGAALFFTVIAAVLAEVVAFYAKYVYCAKLMRTARDSTPLAT